VWLTHQLVSERGNVCFIPGQPVEDLLLDSLWSYLHLQLHITELQEMKWKRDVRCIQKMLL